MFDLKFILMLRDCINFHAKLNDYRETFVKRRNITHEDLKDLHHDFAAKWNINTNDLGLITIYMRMCFVYFATYYETKLQKQKKQLLLSINDRDMSQYFQTDY